MNPSCTQSIYRSRHGDFDKSYSELHALGTGGSELSGNDDLATLGARLHDEAEDTIASTADGETVEKLVTEGLALGDGGQTARFWMSEVSSRMRRPCSPRTSCVWVARMMMSVTVGVTRTSTPE
ncbi:uncharacterized protein M421DRAFT_277851 [Didymella exigua CBS 183.55]|uniref:Uncharacterized protein n=1 Tax=Didymella exigua CBS 183.55 TaxID=1150837 RepID=A0A6A5RBE5_9PLEO|nr:uncharacterized protein M421DRAFT_277851 [Didymella exigua CBS 183.55]KAF1924600.1 hypothetical protein M421DRAFT_277851 [Didymella exigua CBS 183.55]